MVFENFRQNTPHNQQLFYCSVVMFGLPLATLYATGFALAALWITDDVPASKREEIEVSITTYSGIAAAVCVQVVLFTILGIYSADHITDDLNALERNRKYLEKYNENIKSGALARDLLKIADSDDDD